MRNLTKTLLFGTMLCVGLTFNACSDDKENVIPQGEDDDNLEMGYVAPLIGVSGNLTTKAADTEVGNDDENNINAIRLVYFNKESGVAEYAFDYDNAAIHGANPTTDPFKGASLREGKTSNNKRIFLKAERVAVREYELLVIVNPSTEIKKITTARRTSFDDTPASTGVSSKKFFTDNVAKVSNNDLTAFIGAVNSPSLGAYTPTEFLMTNFQGLVNIPAKRVKPTAESAEAEADLDGYVYVDRAVAKIKVLLPKNAIGEVKVTNATIENLTWRSDVTNNKSFWMRQMDKMKFGVAHNANAVTEGSIDVSERHFLYAKDPNFDKFSLIRSVYTGETAPADKLAEEFRTIGTTDVTLNPLSGHYEYVLENTMEAKEQYEDVTTSIILKLKYLPTKSALGTTPMNPKTDGYYVWNGYVFTAADLELIKTTEPDPEKTEPGLHDMFLTLKAYLVAHYANLTKPNTEGGFGPGFNSPDKTKSYVDNADKQIAYVNPDNYNYYRIPIRHFDDTIESRELEYGRFGVVRNNVYMLTITGINGPGSIVVPPPYYPDDKLHYVAADIEVLPWVVRKQDVIAGDN